MDTNTLVTFVVPAFVAALTAAGGVIGVQFRDADAFERRRGVWLLMLVATTAIVTSAAMNSASGVGRPLAAALLTLAAIGTAVGTHLLWRRVVPHAEQRTVTLAMAAVGVAAVVLIASVSLTYAKGKGCRQAEELIGTGLAQSAYVLPSFGEQGPAPGEFADWAKILHEQADKVTAGNIAPRAQQLADLADQITAMVRFGDSGTHALLGAQFYDVLKSLMSECYPQ
jgi:hypothetical protein